MAGRKDNRDRTCADSGSGSVPDALTRFLKRKIMEMDKTFIRAAEELKAAGFRVFVWQDDYYQRSWNKGDYTMVYYAMSGSENIGYLSHGDCGMGVCYGREYVPSRRNGSGCRMLEEDNFNIKTAEAIIKASLPSWLNGRPDQYRDIDHWYNSDKHNQKIFKEI